MPNILQLFVKDGELIGFEDREFKELNNDQKNDKIGVSVFMLIFRNVIVWAFQFHLHYTWPMRLHVA